MIETTILSALIHNDTYARKVLPFLVKDYFHDLGHQIIYKLIKDFSTKYNKCPSPESLSIELENSSLSERPFENANEVLGKLTMAEVDTDWLVDQTEQFCKRQALVNAITTGGELLMKNEAAQYGKMLELVQQALSVNFDEHIGHDYMADSDARFEFYHDTEEQLECDLAMLNVVTGGGFRNKSFAIFMAPTGVGKTMVMCHLASSYLMQGKSVLYVTLEMAEEMIAERIDANLLDVDISKLKELDRSSFNAKMVRLKKKAMGSLIIKQYPPASAHVGHFRHLLNELRLKRKFTPDVIFFDYLNICASSRAAKGANSYDTVKAIAEELRGLGVEFGCRIISATQTNRDGAENADFGLTQTSESFGVPMTADYMFAVISTPQMEEAGRIKVKQLKNRYNDITRIKSFLLNIDRSRMRLSDCEEDAGEDDKPRQADIIPQETRAQDSDFDKRFADLLTG